MRTSLQPAVYHVCGTEGEIHSPDDGDFLVLIMLLMVMSFDGADDDEMMRLMAIVMVGDGEDDDGEDDRGDSLGWMCFVDTSTYVR